MVPAGLPYRSPMLLIANILLALATLITLLVAQIVADAHPVNGADAMGLIVVIPVLMAQWAVIAGAVLIAARRGGLSWMPASRGIQALAAVLWCAAVGLTASSTVVMGYGPSSAAIVPWAFGLAVIVPVVVIAGTAWSLHVAAGGSGQALRWRLGVGVLTLCAGAAALQMYRLESAFEKEAAAAAAVADRQRAEWDAAHARAFAALPATAPLREWMPWMQASDDVGSRAIAAVRARPTLEQDVAAMLRSDEATEALRFMWLWMPEPRSALAEPARDAIATLPEWTERWLATPPRPPESPVDSPDPIPALRPVDLSDMAQAAIVIADGYKSSGLDFDTPIAAFARTLERHALPEDRLGEDPTYQPRAFLRTWLEGRARTLIGRE